MGSHYEAPIRRPLVAGEKSYHDVTVDIARPIETRANKQWWIVFLISLAMFLWGLGWIIYTISTGIGVWGLNKTVGWAWDITNFVWWVGIGHAGTLISAVLLLFRQKWRMAINRSAEAMTIFSVIQAGLFPIIHMGRPWLAYWMLPIPMDLVHCGLILILPSYGMYLLFQLTFQFLLFFGGLVYYLILL